MDSEKNTPNAVCPEEKSRQAVYISAVEFVDDGENRSVRFTVERDLSVPLSSFTVSYRFAGAGRDGVRESRFFSLNYARESLNTKETIPIRMKVPDGYNAVGCTAFVSEIVYSDGHEEKTEFSDSAAVSCMAENIDFSTGKKKLPKGVKALLISAISVLCAGLIVAGGIFLSRYLNVKSVVNGLIEENRYGEAYRIAGECGGIALGRTTAGNIVSKCLGERDFKTAYVYASIVGKTDAVWKRVEYEMTTSGKNALESDAFSVLKKLDDDELFDTILKKFIEKTTGDGDYPAAMTACEQLRNESERNLMLRELLVNGACYYSSTSKLSGIGKYDRALEYLDYYSKNGIDGVSVAREIISRCLEGGDSAGAVVLSMMFSGMYDGFDIDPASIEISPHSKSIALSLDYAYPLLTDGQKRAYHSDPLAISEEAFCVSNGTVKGTDISNAVSVATYENRTAVLRSDGSVTHLTNNKHNTSSTVPAGVNAVQIAVGLSHTVILNDDGTVVAVGDNSRGQCGTEGWTDIVEVAAGRYFTVGLKSDGTLMACGSDKCGVLLLGGFSNVISVGACDQTVVMLFRDGTVMLRGEQSMGLRKANNFTNVEQIKAGGNAVVALLSDGTFVMADGSVGSRSGSVENWKAENITAFAVGSQCISYLDRNGHVIITGDGASK